MRLCFDFRTCPITPGHSIYMGFKIIKNISLKYKFAFPKRLLLPSKDYFNNLKADFPMVDISKSDFEIELVKADVLCTVQRKIKSAEHFRLLYRRGKLNSLY